ncbi:MAG: hypothetical protein KC442_07355 [Thermomicrobiales bacterium]|nr:hypothetical protein [Thermomicrobiales bacterium]
MLAYTAVDSLRAISRTFDLDWQPPVNAELANARRAWRNSLRARPHPGWPSVVTLIAVLAPGAPWAR